MAKKLFGKFVVGDRICIKGWAPYTYYEILCIGKEKYFRIDESGIESIDTIEPSEYTPRLSIWEEPKLEFDFTRDYFWGKEKGIANELMFKKIIQDYYLLVSKLTPSGSFHCVGIYHKSRIAELYEPIEDQPLKDWGLE